MNILGLFPGQGSQIIGMGKNWFDNSEQARTIFNAADEVLGFHLSKLCFEGPIEELTLTQNAQPALLTVSVISYLLSEISLSAAAGHSLGEYSALVAAGSLKFEEAVNLVYKRGVYMQEAVPVNTGSMAAVMGVEESELNQLIDLNPLKKVEIANINSPGQIVIAGERLNVEEFCKILATQGAKVIPLKVSAPFHCSLMKPAAEKLAADLDQIEIATPKIAIYSNFTAQQMRTSDEIRKNLKDQVCGTVRWTQQMQNLVREQASTSSIEFGPGGVLTKLMKRIEPSISRYEIFDFESLENTKSKIS